MSKTLSSVAILSLAKGEGIRMNLGDTPRPPPEGVTPPLDSPIRSF